MMVAVGCLMGLAPLPRMLLTTAFAGAAYGLAVAIRRKTLRQTQANVATIVEHHSREGLKPHPELNVANPETVRLPFALPIAAGCVAAVWGSWQ